MEVLDRRYERGDITMAYSDSPGPPGQTFVLVHGIGMGRVVYAKVAEVLVTRGRVLSVDLPGFGDSPEPGSATSLEVTAEIIAEFIRDVAGEPVVLVGHSMGTQIVAETACHHPDLVSALVLIAPTVNRRERTALKQAARMAQDLVGEGSRVLFIGLWEYMKTSPRWFIEKLRFTLGHKIEEVCPRIHTPTLVLRGETDRVCPREWASEVARLLPRGRMREIQGRGHEAIIKSAEPVGSMILEFTESPAGR